MSKHRDYADGQVLGAGFLDALNELLGTFVSNFGVVRASGTTAKVVQADGTSDPAAGNGQVAISIAGAWRYVTAAVVSGAAPALAAGVHDIYVTASANNTGQEDAGTFDYSFALALVQTGTTPVTSLYRKVGTYGWDGTAIQYVQPLFGPGSEIEAMPIGIPLPYAGSADPTGKYTGRLLLAEGRLVDRSCYAAYYALAAHAYNGGVDPGSNKVRINDLRGRVPVGADNMGTAQGAASRIANHNRTLGQNGGAERIALATGEIPSHAHRPSNTGMSFTLWNPGDVLPIWSTAYGTGSYDWAQYQTNSTEAIGGGGFHENMQPYEIDNWIVRVA